MNVLNHFVVECKFVEKSLFYDWLIMYRQPESANKPVIFAQIQPITQTSFWMCNIIFAQWSVTLY